MTFNKWAYELRCYQFVIVTECFHLAGPMMRTAKYFEDDKAGLLPRHKLGELRMRQLLAEHDLTGPTRVMDLDNILCQIYTNHYIIDSVVLSFVELSTPRQWQIAMPSGKGGNHSI